MASKRWTEEEMKAAIDEVQSGKMTQYRAAKIYKIPRQTLNDRLTNKVMSGNVGRPIRLSVAEENEIVEACIIFSEWGYGIGKKEVISIVADYCKSKKKARKEMVEWVFEKKPTNCKGKGRLTRCN